MPNLVRSPSIVPDLPAAPAFPGIGLRFSLEGVPERERIPFFREHFGRSVIHYDVEPLPDLALDIDVRFKVLPELMMMWGTVYGSRNRRTPEMLALDGTDDVGLVVSVRGPQIITHGKDEFVLADGEAMLTSLAEACSYTHPPPGDIMALRVPRSRLAPLVRDFDDRCFRRIPAATPALRLLINYVRLAQDGPDSPQLQSLVAGHVCDLMAAAAGATRDAANAAAVGGLRAARLYAIKNDIAKHLDQPDLSVASLAVRHSCTPRFIQRLFEAEGTTFTEYVLTERLARAYRMLKDQRRTEDKISTIALDAGFSDVSYFNRAFRQLYGETPSGVRAHAWQLA